MLRQNSHIVPLAPTLVQTWFLPISHDILTELVLLVRQWVQIIHVFKQPFTYLTVGFDVMLTQQHGASRKHLGIATM